MPSGKVAQIRAVQDTVHRPAPGRHPRPLVVRRAGTCGSPTRRHDARIVYSPHCYAFQRQDVPGMARAAYWVMEAVLSFRTDGVAAVGEWEQELAARLPSAPDSRARAPSRAAARRSSDDGRSRRDGPVVTVGRIGPQKDPTFFADGGARRPPARRQRASGGGSAAATTPRPPAARQRRHRHRLAARVPRSLRELADAHAYVHTAAWEGNPVTVLEAASVGLPIVARDIPPVRHAGVERLASHPHRVGPAGARARRPVPSRRSGHGRSVPFVSRSYRPVAGRGAARALRLADADVEPTARCAPPASASR